MSENPSNGYRLDSIESRLAKLEALEVPVVKQQVLEMRHELSELRKDLRADMGEIKEDQSSVRKLLIGFLVTFAFSAVTTVIAVLSLSGESI